MKTYRFNNKKSKNSYTLVYSVVAVIAIIVLFNIDVCINKQLLFLISSIGAFIYTMVLIKQAGKEIKEITIENEKIRIVFFNKMKKEYLIEKEELAIQIENEKIVFTNKTKADFNGIAYRKMMEESSEWDDLVNMIQ